MKVFISWSGARSQKLAELLADWIPNVIQSVECFYSSMGIRAGDRWNEEINAQLEHTNFGILCVTPANIGAPWLNYEAGALAKRVTEKSRVVPITMGFPPSTLKPPLSQFNGVTDDEAGFKSLIISIADAAEVALNVDKAFAVWWPILEADLAKLPAPEADVEPPAPPSTDDMLAEVLGVVQGLQADLASTQALVRDKGRFADPADLLDIATLAKLMDADPTLRKTIASAGPQRIRSVMRSIREELPRTRTANGRLVASKRLLDEERARGNDDGVFYGWTGDDDNLFGPDAREADPEAGSTAISPDESQK